MGYQARAAARQVALLSTDRKNEVLSAMAVALREDTARILDANRADLEAAAARHMPPAMIERLRLDAPRVEEMARGIDAVAALPDPVGTVIESRTRPNGMLIEQVRVPIGVIAMIYESRPNVTADAAALCFKAGNAVILRGGSEAFRSNSAIAEALARGGAPQHAVQLVPFTGREGVALLAGMDRWIDLLIPRGGKGLVETVVSLARMPVIKHYDGICHLYADAAADPAMAVRLIVDAKTQKCGVCNAVETLLVHRDIAASFLPAAAAELRRRGVELRACPASLAWVADAVPATDADWDTEYLDLILSVRVVDSLDEAIAHINRHGSHHTDVIVTADPAAAERFLREVESACVFHNVSSRLADGGEFGFGAEIGISTDKLHARGPMGLRELTTGQYRVRGSGQTKA